METTDLKKALFLTNKKVDRVFLLSIVVGEWPSPENRYTSGRDLSIAENSIWKQLSSPQLNVDA